MDTFNEYLYILYFTFRYIIINPLGTHFVLSYGISFFLQWKNNRTSTSQKKNVIDSTAKTKLVLTITELIAYYNICEKVDIII